MPKKYAQCRRAAATGIASQRVCAKILELVLGRSTTTDSFDWGGIVVRKLSHVLVLPAYWTLGLHGGLRSITRITHCETNDGDHNNLLSERSSFLRIAITRVISGRARQ